MAEFTFIKVVSVPADLWDRVVAAVARQREF